jgi:hypothetical protein
VTGSAAGAPSAEFFLAAMALSRAIGANLGDCQPGCRSEFFSAGMCQAKLQGTYAVPTPDAMQAA